MASSVDVENILKEINNKIAMRRIAGEYPPGLELQLEREFAEIISQTNRRYFSNVEIRRQIELLKHQFDGLTGQTTTRSRIPGLSLIHRILKFLTRRQVIGLTAQIRAVTQQNILVLESLVTFAQAQEDADSRLIRELVNHVMDRISVIDHLAMVTTELENRMKKIETETGS